MSDDSRWRYLGNVAERARRNRDVPTTRDEWEGLPAEIGDEHLGHDRDDWCQTEDDRGRSVFLPGDGDMLAEDEFIVASPSAVVEAGRWF